MFDRTKVALLHVSGVCFRIARNEKGIALPLVGIFASVLLGMAALALDLSRISVTANEVQRAADIAATSGAGAMFARPQGETLEEAQVALRANFVDNNALENSNLIELQEGNFDEDTGAFVSNLPPFNSVRAVVRSTVRNLLIGGFSADFMNTVVTKEAVAAFRGAGRANPTLPIAIGSCHYDEDCFTDNCMPKLAKVPNTSDSTAWTAFLEVANPSNVNHYLDACVSGGGGQSPDIEVGDFISIATGSLTGQLRLVKDIVEDCGKNKFLLPVVPCGSAANQKKEVLGFATVIIDSIKTSGSGQGITMHGIYEDTPGTIGGGNFGTGSIGLVQ